MHEYEIRILRPNRKPAFIIETQHVSDIAAVRAAKKFAQKRDFEVWRGTDCIYGEGHRPAPPDRPGQSPAA